MFQHEKFDTFFELRFFGYIHKYCYFIGCYNSFKNFDTIFGDVLNILAICMQNVTISKCNFDFQNENTF
jgi:hypothetical protein